MLLFVIVVVSLEASLVLRWTVLTRVGVVIAGCGLLVSGIVFCWWLSSGGLALDLNDWNQVMRSEEGGEGVAERPLAC